MQTSSAVPLAAATVALALTTASGQSCPGPVFSPEARYPAGPSAANMAVGDFNNDTHPDLVTTLSNTRAVAVLLNNGDGTFGAPQQFPTSAVTAFGIAVDDFNNDQIDDVVVGGGQSGYVMVMLGDGNGGLGPSTEFGTGVFGAPTSLAPGDFDGDGNVDLAVNTNSSNIRVFRGLGNGTLANPDFLFIPGTTGTLDIRVAHMDADTDPDLVIGDQNAVVVLRGAAGTSFTTTTPVSFSSFNRGVDVGDFDNNGTIDVITSGVLPEDVSVYLNNGAGALSFASSIVVSSVPTRLRTADFDLDGNLDAAINITNSDAMGLLQGDGSGAVSLAGTFPGGNEPLAVVVDDFDSNGTPDVATVQRASGDVSVYLNACPAACNAADIAAPFGVLDLADIDAFIAAFTSASPDADIAPPSGVLDLADIDAFIAAFFGGCP